MCGVAEPDCKARIIPPTRSRSIQTGLRERACGRNGELISPCLYPASMVVEPSLRRTPIASKSAGSVNRCEKNRVVAKDHPFTPINAPAQHNDRPHRRFFIYTTKRRVKAGSLYQFWVSISSGKLPLSHQPRFCICLRQGTIGFASGAHTHN